jgi:hypothetical protein
MRSRSNPGSVPGQVDTQGEAERDHEDEIGPGARPSEGSCRHEEQDAHGAEPNEGLSDQSDDHGHLERGRLASILALI